MLWGSLFIGLLQSFITLTLHCCELVVLLARDEATWRAAYTKKGARPLSNPLLSVLKSWQSLVLLASKPVLHWFFGQAVGLRYGQGVAVSAAALFKLAVGMAGISDFVTYVAFRKPKGPQPAAYGRLRTLVDLVDEWSVTTVMYWGDKTDPENTSRVRHAGTSSKPLLKITLYELYAGSEHGPGIGRF